MRLGNEFCRELANILTERSDLEIAYSKGLNKVGLRLQKLSKEFIGGLSDAWLQVSLQFDSEADMHKNFASVLQEDLVKPLKSMMDNQIENSIEKALKNMGDKRAKDYKYRTRCFKTSKDIETTMYTLDEAQKGVGGKPPKQKDIQKLEEQLGSLKTLLETSELKYHKACGHVEFARQEWHITMSKGCELMQQIEEERISQLDALIKRYTGTVAESGKKVAKMLEMLQKVEINVKFDIDTSAKKFGTTKETEQELFLFDIFSENTKNLMNRERRILNLSKWSKLLSTDVEAQLKAKEGLERHRHFTRENPKFANNSDDEISQKILSVQLLHLLYEASLFKVESSLAELVDKPKPTYRFFNNLQTTYDKMAIPQTILKLTPLMMPTSTKASAPQLPTDFSLMQMPQPMIISSSSGSNSPSSTLYGYSNGSDVPPSYHVATGVKNPFHVPSPITMGNMSIEYSDDEWDESSIDHTSSANGVRCAVLYDYKSERDDELKMSTGDVIRVLEKRPDGWWRGQLNGSTGLFPSTYVKEMQ